MFLKGPLPSRASHNETATYRVDQSNVPKDKFQLIHPVTDNSNGNLSSLYIFKVIKDELLQSCANLCIMRFIHAKFRPLTNRQTNGTGIAYPDSFAGPLSPLSPHDLGLPPLLGLLDLGLALQNLGRPHQGFLHFRQPIISHKHVPDWKVQVFVCASHFPTFVLDFIFIAFIGENVDSIKSKEHTYFF